MTDDNVFASDILKHCGGHLAGMRTFFNFGRTILRRHSDVGALEPISNDLERCEDWSDDYFAMISVGDKRLQRERCVHRFAKRLVHLPISSNYRFSHDRISSSEYSLQAELLRTATS